MNLSILVLALCLFSPTQAADLKVGKGLGETPNVVVMEYEPWFGGGAQNDFSRPPGYGSFSVLPLLRSAGMRRDIDFIDYYGHRQVFTVDGYDSSDPAVIRKHIEQLEAMGVDALIVDFTNRVANYNSTYTVGSEYVMIKNIRAIYREIHNAGSTLKLIPLIGVYQKEDVESGGFSDLINDWYGMMVDEFPGHNIIYENKPLIVVFHAVGTESPSSCGAKSCWQMTRDKLSITRPSKYSSGNWMNYVTIRHMGGLYDSQPSTWGEFNRDAFALKSQLDPSMKFWTWVDRFSQKHGLFPSYAVDSQGRVEAFTAASATGSPMNNPTDPTEIQNKCYATRRGGYACNWGRYPKFGGDNFYYPDDAALRVEDGVYTLSRFMHQAREIKPTFLLIGQWNQFEQTDEGFDFYTTHSLEPADFGPGIDSYGPYNLAKKEIQLYKETVSGKLPAQSGFKNIALRGLSGSGENTLIAGFVSTGGLKRILIRGLGPTLKYFGVQNVNPNPNIVLFEGSNAISDNDNWAEDLASHKKEVIAANWNLEPDPNESILTRTMKDGSYSVHLGGSDSSARVGFLEVVDSDSSNSHLTNISGRAYVGKDENILIGGFVIRGGPRKVFLRGSGPSLSRFGIQNVLADPMIVLFSGQNRIASNDNWKTNSNAGEIGTLPPAWFPMDDKDGALLVTLDPGSYSVHLLGVDQGVGIGHIEITDLRP